MAVLVTLHKLLTSNSPRNGSKSMTGENDFQANVFNPYTYKSLFYISESQVLLKCEIWRVL